MKTKTRKRLKKVIFFFCASVIILIMLLYLCLGYIVKTAVLTLVPKMTGTPVKIESFSFSMFSGKARMKNFIIGNPAGFNTEYAFSIDDLLVEVNMDTLFSRKIVIDQIKVSRAHVIYEQGLTTSNLSEINANIRNFTKSEKEGGQKDEKADSPVKNDKGEGRKVQINDFYFNDAKVSISAVLLQGAKTSISISDIHLKDIGKDGDGESTGDAAVLIFSAIYKSIGKTASSGADSIKGIGEDALDKIKGFFN